MKKSDMYEQLLDIIFNVFSKTGIEKEMIIYADFIEDLNMESLVFISLIVEIESFFKITFPDDILLMSNFRSFNEILEQVQELLLPLENSKCDEEQC